MTMTATFDLSLLLCAAAIDLGRPVTGDVCWLRAQTEDLTCLTPADRVLVHVVTGEHLAVEPGETDLPVSFFVHQIVWDRLSGVLQPDDEVSIEYVESVFDAYEQTCADGNPVSGDLFDLALAYLVGRDLASPGPGYVTV